MRAPLYDRPPFMAQPAAEPARQCAVLDPTGADPPMHTARGWLAEPTRAPWPRPQQPVLLRLGPHDPACRYRHAADGALALP
jgi:hypothetical protein